MIDGSSLFYTSVLQNHNCDALRDHLLDLLFQQHCESHHVQQSDQWPIFIKDNPIAIHDLNIEALVSTGQENENNKYELIVKKDMFQSGFEEKVIITVLLNI